MKLSRFELNHSKIPLHKNNFGHFMPKRTIKNLKIHDMSIVDKPAQEPCVIAILVKFC